MIAVALLLAGQTVQTLPPPTAGVQSPMAFSCTFLTPAGERFSLSGQFPEFPAGWDVNRGLATELKGNGPAGLVGTVEVKPFSATPKYRRYHVKAKIPEGGHYNAMFVLLAEDTGAATIERFFPDVQKGGGVMKSVATGGCESDFRTGNAGTASK